MPLSSFRNKTEWTGLLTELRDVQQPGAVLLCNILDDACTFMLQLFRELNYMPSLLGMFVCGLSPMEEVRSLVM